MKEFGSILREIKGVSSRSQTLREMKEGFKQELDILVSTLYKDHSGYHVNNGLRGTKTRRKLTDHHPNER